MISILFGPGGSGKSALQMHIVRDQLRETQRNICTNLAIDVAKLNDYLERKYPGESLRATERIRILTVEETKQFWRYRGPKRWKITDGEFGPDLDQVDDKGEMGCCFIIDEAGASGFSALGWAAGGESRAARGVECAAYLDQQRKHSDDVFASTNGRTPNSIAKGFRDKAHYFIKLKNGYLHKMGIFKGPAKFTWKKYTEEPGNNSEPMQTGEFRIEKDGLMDCYRTQDGVGVSGFNADKGARAKGIPMWTLMPAALVLGLLVILIPYAMAKGVGKFVATKAEQVQGAGAKGAPERQDGVPPVAVVAESSAGIRPSGISPGQPQADANPAPPPRQQPVWVLGYVVKGGRYNILLTDGRTLSEDDGTLVKAGRNFVETKDGERYWWKKPDFSAAPSPAPVAKVAPAPVPVPQKPPQPSTAETPQGSWVTGEDGVTRLREKPSLPTVSENPQTLFKGPRQVSK